MEFLKLCSCVCVCVFFPLTRQVQSEIHNNATAATTTATHEENSNRPQVPPARVCVFDLHFFFSLSSSFSLFNWKILVVYFLHTVLFFSPSDLIRRMLCNIKEDIIYLLSKRVSDGGNPICFLDQSRIVFEKLNSTWARERERRKRRAHFRREEGWDTFT